MQLKVNDILRLVVVYHQLQVATVSPDINWNSRLLNRINKNWLILGFFSAYSKNAKTVSMTSYLCSLSSIGALHSCHIKRWSASPHSGDIRIFFPTRCSALPLSLIEQFETISEIAPRYGAALLEAALLAAVLAHCSAKRERTARDFWCLYPPSFWNKKNIQTKNSCEMHNKKVSRNTLRWWKSWRIFAEGKKT